MLQEKIELCKGKKVGKRIERAETVKDFVCWSKKFGFYPTGDNI